MANGPTWRVGLTALGVGAVVFACWAPTQVTVSIVSDISCAGPVKPKTAIYLGDDIATAELQTDTRRCEPGKGGDTDIGSLVVVPSEDLDARVVVHVVMNTLGGDLEP